MLACQTGLLEGDSYITSGTGKREMELTRGMIRQNICVIGLKLYPLLFPKHFLAQYKSKVRKIELKLYISITFS